MSEVTRVLAAVEQGDPKAAEELLPLLYDEMRQRRRVGDLKRSCLWSVVVTILLGLGGCASFPSFEQQSDWRWQQSNPNYRLPYPPDY